MKNGALQNICASSRVRPARSRPSKSQALPQGGDDKPNQDEDESLQTESDDDVCVSVKWAAISRQQSKSQSGVRRRDDEEAEDRVLRWSHGRSGTRTPHDARRGSPWHPAHAQELPRAA